MARRQDPPLIQKIIISAILLYVIMYVEPISEELYWLRQVCILLLCISAFKFTLSFLDLARNLLLRWYALTPSQKYGSARWASEKDLKRGGLFKTNGLFLGTSARSGKPIFFSGETHGLTLSPAGGGKTVNFFIPALLHNSAPMIVPDLKGTLACITKRAREKKHKNKVYCVNPAQLYKKKLGKPSRYNPLQILVDIISIYTACPIYSGNIAITVAKTIRTLHHAPT